MTAAAGRGPLHVADAVTGTLKYTIDYRRHGLEHCQGFVMDKFCPDRTGLQIAVVGKDHRLLLFDCTGDLTWVRRTYTGLVTRADWNGDRVPEILVFAVGTDLDPAWSMGVNVNNASVSTVMMGVFIVVVVVVVLAKWIPAWRAARLATPSGAAKWHLPSDHDGSVCLTLPFKVTRDNRLGVFAILTSVYQTRTGRLQQPARS